MFKKETIGVFLVDEFCLQRNLYVAPATDRLIAESSNVNNISRHIKRLLNFSWALGNDFSVSFSSNLSIKSYKTSLILRMLPFNSFWHRSNIISRFHYNILKFTKKNLTQGLCNSTLPYLETSKSFIRRACFWRLLLGISVNIKQNKTFFRKA